DIPIAPGSSGRPDAGQYEVIEYNPEKAKEFLAASNYNGEPFVIATVSGSSDEVSAQIIQGQLIEIGINCQVNAMDGSTYNDATTSGTFNATNRFGGVSVLDADGMYYTWNKANATKNGTYFDAMRFSDELDQLMIDGRKGTDEAERKEIYAKACNIITENAWAVTIFYDVNAVAYNKDLTGVVARSLNGLYFFNDWNWN
ncbi:MAG: hypothetical protein IKN04_20635, partial [Clostridia bacterium]|nr:hypothetical protein [Clostridia bacterium]